MVTLIKEIGSDALFALLRTLEGEALERARAFYAHCRDDDLAVAVAQTDVKGDRSLAPSEQPDPDMYVRVVDTSDDGIVVRGAKCHTSISANAHEIIVLPTRAMNGDDADYAVAFAVPANTPGLSMYISSYSAGERNDFEFPLSSPQDARDAHGVRRRVRAVGPRVPVPRPDSPAALADASSSTTGSPRSPTSCRCSTRSSAARSRSRR